MPGIAGIISRRPPDVCRRLVRQMVRSMQHEKFHVGGGYAAPELGIFAGWVALENSFADCQPIVNERDDTVLLFAGECFSDRGTRSGLKARGHQFEGTDATWLIHLYEERGTKFFEELNGVFSGLLIDRLEGQAYLFNDRYGMERIYYHESPDAFFFASEAKALLRVVPELRRFDDSGLDDFLQYGCTLEDRTLFRGVRLLPRASLWTFESWNAHKTRHFDPSRWQSATELHPNEVTGDFERTFTEVLPRYFAGDEPLGISLTGGLDTRMIMARRPRSAQPLLSYTFAGQAGETLDARLAGRVAAACGVPHRLLRIGDDFFSQFASLADRTIYITDGYLGPRGTHEIYLNRQARDVAPIRLTGNFGSEVLRGITTFKPLRLAHGLIDVDLAGRARHDIPALDRHPVSLAIFQEIPWHLFGVIRAAQSQLTVRTPYLDHDLVALAFRVPRALGRSSAAALALVNSDSQLRRIPTDQGLVAASAFLYLVNYAWCRTSFKADYWLGDGMPHWLSALDSRLSPLGLRLPVAGLHKYLHYARWFRGPLSALVIDRLTAVTSRTALWNKRFVQRMAEDHMGGKRNYASEINAVLTIEAIERLLFTPTTEDDFEV